MAYEKEDLEKILEEDFLLEADAFGPGRRNDDTVDSMCICHALDVEWTEFFAKWCDAHGYDDGDTRVKLELEHYERVREWLNHKEATGYPRGDDGIMVYAINY